ncbi:MAG: hypothetical protein IT327_20825 [Anaerolineae bacterium]|nr:hypothetical protein [Anaerolineae bacterium]
MTYDSARQVIVMFGGQSGMLTTAEDEFPQTNWLNDTWTFNGDAWQQVNTPISPDSAEGYGMAFDANRNVTVLIGPSQESGETNRLAKMWEFNGSAWQTATEIEEIPAQSYPLLAFDPHQKDLFLFSGFQLSDIWQYDGQSWARSASQVPPLMRGSPIAKVVYFEQMEAFVFTNLTGETAQFTPLQEVRWSLLPSRDESNGDRFGFDMVYDAQRGVIVLFGGQGPARPTEDLPVEVNQTLNDLWEFDGEIWYEVSPRQVPPARYGHAMVYDEARNVVVLFGGIGADGTYLNDTWEYDGVTWVQE